MDNLEVSITPPDSEDLESSDETYIYESVSESGTESELDDEISDDEIIELITNAYEIIYNGSNTSQIPILVNQQ